MRSKKTYIIILVVLAVYFLVFFLTLGRENLKQEKYSTTIIVGNSTIWNYSGKKWTHITNKSTIKKLDWQIFDVYIDNEKLGKYYLWNDDQWYLFDKNKNAVNYTGKLLAYKSNYEINVLQYQEEEITDYSYINEVLTENDLPSTSTFTTSKQAIFDIDNDGIDETLYVISNVFADDYYPENLFAIAFMVKDGEIQYLYKNITSNTDYNVCKPYLNSIIDVNKDDKYEIILSCGRISNQKPTDMLYKLEEDGFKMIISNQ